MQTLGSKTYELYDILNDPLETENLSSKYPDIFNDMKETIDSQTLWMNPPLINPPMMYLWGDRFHTEDRFLGNPWLDRDYELKTPPNKIVSALIFIWILIQAKKNLFLGILLALITMTIIYKKRKTFKSS